MAKRNLARTAIEGGRWRYCRTYEHFETRVERHQTRIDLRKVADDRELADDLVLDERGGGGRSFSIFVPPRGAISSVTFSCG